jgi:hypothetical protein
MQAGAHVVDATTLECGFCHLRGEGPAMRGGGGGGGGGDDVTSAFDTRLTGPFLPHPFLERRQKGAKREPRAVWLHALCAAYAPEAIFDADARAYSLTNAVYRARALKWRLNPRRRSGSSCLARRPWRCAGPAHP